MTAVATPSTERVRLDLEGMTCASCAARIERKLNRLDGVEATVNYATDQATVTFDPGVVTVDELVAAVAAAGYRAALEDAGAAGADDDGGAEGAALVAAVALSLPLARARDGDAAAVRRLGVGGVRALDAGRALGRLALPPRRASSTPATAPRAWTRSSPSARSPPGVGRRSCSSAESTPKRTSRPVP